MKEFLNPILFPMKGVRIEETILGTFKYYCGEQDSSAYIKKYNPNHKFFKLYFPVNEELISSIPEDEKRFDCLFYGRITKMKGIEDFIKIIAEIKKEKPNIAACIIGPNNVEQYKKLAINFSCSKNIEFLGFINNQRELFKIVKQSKVLLVPTYFDRLPSTIREAMFIRVPIIAYATGGIPYLNEFNENILLISKGDYQSMAYKTHNLLCNEDVRMAQTERAYEYAKREFSLEVNSKRLASVYEEILNENISL